MGDSCTYPGNILLSFWLCVSFVHLSVFLDVSEPIDFECMFRIEWMIVHCNNGQLGLIRRTEVNESVTKIISQNSLQY